MTPFKFPPKAQIAERMSALWPQPQYPRWKVPASLQEDGNRALNDTFGADANNPDWRNGPRDWMLRPERDLTQQALIDAVAALPRTNDPVGEGRDYGYRNFPQPQVQSNGAGLFRAYLAPTRPDNVIENNKIVGRSSMSPWKYRGRTITPDGGTRWLISGTIPELAHAFGCTPSNPTVEWWMGTELTVSLTGEERDTLVYHRHPDEGWSDPNVPIDQRPGHFGRFEIVSCAVYGTAWADMKQLGFMGGLDVAINYIECLDWALGLASKPAWLGGTVPEPKAAPESPQPAESADPIADAIRSLDSSDKSLWTRSGKPRVDAVEAVLGYDISAAERTAAWKRVVA